jgi:HEPN domain-containing protein
MQRDPRTELTRQWLQTASEDLELAALALRAEPALLSGAVFHSQQAFEKSLKGFLAWHEKPLARTHNLSGLVTLCEQIDPTFTTLAEDAAMVNPFATQFRYPPLATAPTQPDAADALRAARGAFAFVCERLPALRQP